VVSANGVVSIVAGCWTSKVLWPKLYSPSISGFCDVDEMVLFYPSCNTDQGVYHMCEYAGVKPVCGMKVRDWIL